MAGGNWENGNNPTILLISVNLFCILHGFLIYSAQSLALLILSCCGLIKQAGEERDGNCYSRDTESDGLERNSETVNPCQGNPIPTVDRIIGITLSRSLSIHFCQRQSTKTISCGPSCGNDYKTKTSPHHFDTHIHIPWHNSFRFLPD